MYLGIDIGTSSVKAVLVDAEQTIRCQAHRALQVSRPRPGWCEQDPQAWIAATFDCVDALKAEHPELLAAVNAIGLSGQMHGATLLDAQDKPLRPCILWNDGRSSQECAELERACPASRALSGNIAMPGFTAPKVSWVRKHEPNIFGRIAKVLLPKDFVRLHLSGDYVSDMSDSAGTLWLDVAARDWSQQLLDACDLDAGTMPGLVEGSAAGGELSGALARRWGMHKPPLIAGGAGDNAASACGIGAVSEGSAFISLGTSGVLFVVTGSFMPNTDSAVHAFCHAVPDTWHQMGVILSAAASFEWLARTHRCKVVDLFNELDGESPGRGKPIFLPYLSGERTPHNDPSIRGAFIGLDHDTDRVALTRAVAEGVGFAFRDCLEALRQAGSRIDRLVAVGGGSRSAAWLQILADILRIQIDVPTQSDHGAAFGAARLAMLADTGDGAESVCTPPKIVQSHSPDSANSLLYQDNWARYRAIYPALKEVS